MKWTFARPSLLVVAITGGLMLGASAFTFGYARGYSYLTNDPAACANCHVMSEHFNAWLKSSHRNVARCNDCHAPHNLIGKYITKARNGFWHSFYFTIGRYPDPLRATPRNKEIADDACRYCHEDIVDAIDPKAHARTTGDEAGPHVLPLSTHSEDACVRCHTYVGHYVR